MLRVVSTQTLHYRLLGIMQELAPNSEAQKKCAERYALMLQQMHKDFETKAEVDRNMEKALVNMIAGWYNHELAPWE